MALFCSIIFLIFDNLPFRQIGIPPFFSPSEPKKAESESSAQNLDFWRKTVDDEVSGLKKIFHHLMSSHRPLFTFSPLWTLSGSKKQKKIQMVLTIGNFVPRFLRQQWWLVATVVENQTLGLEFNSLNFTSWTEFAFLSNKTQDYLRFIK